jgi:hypothetical protein
MSKPQVGTDKKVYMMDKTSQEEFTRIVSLAPHELTKEDILFLRARRTYLESWQEKKFMNVLRDVLTNEHVADLTADDEQEPTDQKRLKAHLLKKCRERALKYSNTMTVQQLQTIINNDEFDREAEEEERQRLADEQKRAEQAATDKGHKGNFDEISDTDKKKFE